MLSRADLQRLANREKVALGILEKDYVLTELLKALSVVPKLYNLLVFKGGTALRKIYFPNWRYSEDLDFTVKRDLEKEELRQDLEDWYYQVEQASQIQLTTKMLHKPDGYARVRIQFLGPLLHSGMIYVDLSFDELLYLEPEPQRILTNPFSDEERKILVYPLEELLAEKLRSILERGKSRDYYDVWRILKEHSSQLNFDLLAKVFVNKNKHKELHFQTINDFIPKELDDLKNYWEKDLRQQVSSLLPLEKILNELQEMLDKFLIPYI